MSFTRQNQVTGVTHLDDPVAVVAHSAALALKHHTVVIDSPCLRVRQLKRGCQALADARHLDMDVIVGDDACGIADELVVEFALEFEGGEGGQFLDRSLGHRRDAVGGIGVHLAVAGRNRDEAARLLEA